MRERRVISVFIVAVLVFMVAAGSLSLTVPNVHATIYWGLNVKTVMSDGVTALTNAQVTMTNITSSYPVTVTCGSSGCWANYTQLADSSTVSVKVSWEGSYVNGTFSESITSDVTVTATCNVYSITPVWKTSAAATLIANPTSFKWTPANGTLSAALSPAVAYEVQNGTVSFSAVTWYGTDVTPAVATFSPASGSPTKNLKVYATTPVWLNSTGSAVATPITSFKWTPPNGTLTGTLAPSTAYQLQVGTTTVSAIKWSAVTATPVTATFDAKDGSPNIRLNIPATPTALTVTANAANPSFSLDLAWTDAGTDWTIFHIERGTDGVTYVEITTTINHSYTDTALNYGSTYYYRVRAYRSYDLAYSTYVTANGATQQPLGQGGGGDLTYSYVLVVRVVDSNNIPVSQATVSIPNLSVLSDSNGYANFGAQTSGTYTVHVVTGCGSVDKSVTLSSNLSTSNAETITASACNLQQQQGTSSGSSWTDAFNSFIRWLTCLFGLLCTP